MNQPAAPARPTCVTSLAPNDAEPQGQSAHRWQEREPVCSMFTADERAGPHCRADRQLGQRFLAAAAPASMVGWWRRRAIRREGWVDPHALVLSAALMSPAPRTSMIFIATCASRRSSGSAKSSSVSCWTRWIR